MEVKALATGYRDFFNGDLGIHFSNKLKEMSANRVKKAKSLGKEEAWDLLKESAGIDAVISEIKRLQNMDKSKGGDK